MFSGIDRLLFILENTGKKYNIEKIKKHMSTQSSFMRDSTARAGRNTSVILSLSQR